MLLWSGLAGTTLTATFQDLLKGQAPHGNTQKIGSPTLGVSKGNASPSSGPVPGTSDSTIANTALRYVGNNYVWGGAPGTQKGVDAGTDCSGFVNMVVGRDLGLPIPGYAAGTYDGSTHGAPTTVWLLWPGAQTIQLSQVQAGDLIVFQTHMGIMLSQTQMISALDTNDGVKVTSIADGSPTGEVPFYKRLVTQ